MRLSVIYSVSLLGLLNVATATAKSNNPINANNNKPSFIRHNAVWSIPRGGDAPPSFRQQLDQYETSMKDFTKHYDALSVHMKEVLEKALTFHGKTTKAMEDLELGLFKVSIQLSMLPAELTKHFTILKEHMLTLQQAATTMMDQLAVHIELVTQCAQLVEGLLSEIKTKTSELPRIKKQERRLKNSGTKYAKLQQSVQEDMLHLQQTSLSVRDEVMNMDARGREDVWPTFMENVKTVHEAALNVDRTFRAMGGAGGANGSNNNNTAVAAAPGSMPAGEVMDYGLAADNGVQEVEVEMTTYQYSW